MPHIGNFFNPLDYFESPPTDGETKKAPSSDWAFDHKAAADDHHTPPELTLKVIAIGDWNMDSISQITVHHELTLTTIRQVFVLIRDDNDNIFRPIFCADPAGTCSGWFKMDVGDVVLIRLTDGDFDNTWHSATSYNRGWVLIWHTP